jgi:UTP--glucose-1-phosphate uridylyltransferase
VSEQGLRAAQQKMADAQIHQAAIDVFTAYYHQLEDGVTGFIAEDSIEPLMEPDLLSEVSIGEEQAAQALAGTVLIKLNGGLGTSMGMARAKSLLPVRDGQTFLDLIVTQVRAARARYGA